MIYIYKYFWKSTGGNKALKCKLSIQEKLKDLRIEKGLSLQELSEQTGISRASLGNYETDDYKEISHKAIITLADFYGVTSDYLLGLTENREQHPFPVDELGLDDETVDLLKSGKLNVRLICEMIKHPDYINFISGYLLFYFLFITVSELNFSFKYSFNLNAQK